MGTRELTPEERAKWTGPMNKSVEASPLKFARAGTSANDPYMIEVTNGQWEQDSRKPTLVIHIIKRSDIRPERAMEVVQHALADVFGRGAGEIAEKDYRNVAELKKRLGSNHVINEAHDSMTIIFPPGPIVYTRKTEFVRDKLAYALKVWHDRSAGW